MIPIFVVDRPASLRILSGLTEHKGEFGILAHAFTSGNFKKQFSDFNLATVKVGDSGIFQKKTDYSYSQIFRSYEAMGVNYGIIKDYFRDRKKTLESAELAIKEYQNGTKSFKLIGVAQGKSVAEYLQSYREQRELGLDIVAIGGLLDKIPNHVRLVKVKHDIMLRNVLRAVRTNFPSDKIFPLGVFNRRRLQFFNQVDVWASDYKGWIFKYNKKQADMKNDRFEQTRRYVIEKVFNPLQSNTGTIYDEPKFSANNKEKRLLIMACGKVKKQEPGKAINVYDGPSFKMVRGYLKSRNNHLDIKILSAKYGLIDYKDKISPYDLKLDMSSAEIYRVVFRSDFQKYAESYKEIFVLGGEPYQFVVPKELSAERANGKIGEQLSQLKSWLGDNAKIKNKKL